jgi:hypothetical protein
VTACPPLTRVSDRERAATIVETAPHFPRVDANTLVDALDAVSAALLRSAGLSDTAARAVLAALWDQPVPSAALDVPPRTPRRTDREREYLRDLGQRIHVIRRARRRSSADICRTLDLHPEVLRDLEQGNAIPNALLLHRLAAALQVPVPMLVDPTATPRKVLRLLAAGYP